MDFILLLALSGLLILTFISVRSSFLKLESKQDLLENLAEENENILKKNRQGKIETTEKKATEKISGNYKTT